MKSVPYVLLCVSCAILFPPSSSGKDGETAAPQQAQVRALRKQIDALQAAKDVDGLRKLAAEAKTEWLPAKNAEYYPVILDLCVALNSTAPTPEGYEAMRGLAVSVIDSPGEKPPQILGKLCLLLQGDPDYSRGQLRGEAWITERRRRTERWFTVWKSIREQLAALPEPSGPLNINVSPPVETGLPSGVGPEAVKDPALRKRFEEAIEKNTRNGNTYRKKHDLADFEKRFAADAKRNFIETYSKPPFETDELAKNLQEYGVPPSDRDAILKEVKRREVERADRDAHPPATPSGPQITPLAPPGDSPVHTDPRLRAALSIDLVAPSVDDLLRVLHKATGVELTRADDIQNRSPAFGSLSLRGVQAWKVMDDVAASKRVEGRWEVDGPGYRLVSNGNPVVIPEDAHHSSPPVPTGEGYLRIYFILINAGVIAAVCAAILGYRLGKKKRPPVP
jgi:hypothetical protein